MGALDQLRGHLARQAGDPVAAGRRPFDCAGLYGTICSVAAGSLAEPGVAPQGRVTWTTPLEYGDWFKDFSVACNGATSTR
jgi:hypothetical protein